MHPRKRLALKTTIFLIGLTLPEPLQVGSIALYIGLGFYDLPILTLILFTIRFYPDIIGGFPLIQNYIHDSYWKIYYDPRYPICELYPLFTPDTYRLFLYFVLAFSLISPIVTGSLMVRRILKPRLQRFLT